jgi:hypothetical protein
MIIDWSDPDPYGHAPMTWDPRPDRPGYVTHLGPATIYRHFRARFRGEDHFTYSLKCEAHGTTIVAGLEEYLRERLSDPGSFCPECKANPLPGTWGLSNLQEARNARTI